MNILITNKYSNIFNSIGIDFKRYTGIFDAAQLSISLEKINYQSIIVDISALNNYQNVDEVKKMLEKLDLDKVIIYLDSSVNNTNYLKSLIDYGFYNFTFDINYIKSLLVRPNTYNDAINMINKGVQIVDNKDNVVNINRNHNSKIIGFKNITSSAGATTLVYILVNKLKKKYNVIGVEVDKTDFSYFNSKNLVSTISNKIHYIVNKNNDKDIIFIDVNNSDKAIDVCNDVIYLVEPTTIKMNKLMVARPNVFRELFDKKIVLNKSPLDKWDIAEFENEAHLKIFYNLPCINERGKNDKEIDRFIEKLGIKI